MLGQKDFEEAIQVERFFPRKMNECHLKRDNFKKENSRPSNSFLGTCLLFRFFFQSVGGFFLVD